MESVQRNGVGEIVEENSMKEQKHMEEIDWQSGRKRSRIARVNKGKGETSLKYPFVQKFVYPITDFAQVESVLVSGAVELGQEVDVGEVVEDAVDARMRARCQVVLYNLVE